MWRYWESREMKALSAPIFSKKGRGSNGQSESESMVPRGWTYEYCTDCHRPPEEIFKSVHLIWRPQSRLCGATWTNGSAQINPKPFKNMLKSRKQVKVRALRRKLILEKVSLMLSAIFVRMILAKCCPDLIRSINMYFILFCLVA